MCYFVSLLTFLHMKTYLEKITSAASYNCSPLAIKTIDHDHQVNMGVLLLGSAVTPGTLHLIVCILTANNKQFDCMIRKS